MYRAKRLRLGVEVFDDRKRREVMDRREVQQALVPALADGQFQVYYQPIVSHTEQTTVGVEGLVRWQHPVHGVLGPDRFLEVAEEAGLLARLGEVVMREAVAQTSVWNHLYGPQHAARVGVNLAERQLVDPAFADRVAEVLAWAGVGADQLDLEVGEELLLRRIDDSSRVLHRVAELGCRIVIDDFGITHGAFSRIRDLDLVRAVKIDRSIIAGLGKDNVARAVVEATVSMATALDIEVIAEGVETDEQQAMVVDLGIDLMQGFLFQQPLPAEEFERTGSLSIGR
jgi:EAL domain-containing protein (putative c-di-GMP-specific phosphodiesterase class I)